MDNDHGIMVTAANESTMVKYVFTGAAAMLYNADMVQAGSR